LGDIDLAEEGVDGRGRTDNERRSGVNDSRASQKVATNGGVADIDAANLDLPVTFLGNRDIGKVTLVTVAVNISEHDFGLGVSRGGVEVNAKDLVLNQIFLNHLVKNRNNTVSSNVGVTKTKDTVQRLALEESGKGSSFSEDLVLDVQVSDGAHILREVSFHATSSVLDGDGLPVLGVGGGTVVVILVHGRATFVTASLGRNPEVGRTSIKNNAELLRRGSQSDGTDVLSILVVLEVIDSAG